MRLTLRLLGTEVLDVELHPARPPTPPAEPRPCRFEKPRQSTSERPVIEATGGGDFGFGPRPVVDDRPLPT